MALKMRGESRIALINPGTKEPWDWGSSLTGERKKDWDREKHP